MTGGQYKSGQGCQPYLIKACEHHISGENAYLNHSRKYPTNLLFYILQIKGSLPNCSKVEEKTPSCSSECEASYTVSYKEDKHYGERSYSLHSVSAIMEEISTNGPIEGTMEVYEDFLTYKSGRGLVLLTLDTASYSPSLRRCVCPYNWQDAWRPCYSNSWLWGRRWNGLLARG